MYKLLIVDDEEIERRAIENIIRKGNIKVSDIKHASNGQESVAVASAFEPDIVIMDITMPGLNGIKAASIITKFLQDIRIIFLTAFDEFDYAKKALKLGADDFLVKPALPETIESAINNSIKSIEKKKEQQLKSQITKDRLSGASKYLEECLMEALIDGESDEKRISKYLSFTNIDFNFCFGSIVSMSFEDSDSYSESGLETKKRMVIDKICLKIKGKIINSVIFTKGMSIHILVYENELDRITDAQTMLGETAEFLKLKIYSENSIVLNFGIGEISKSYDTIWSSFMHAKEKVQSKKTIKSSDTLSSITDELARNISCNCEHISRTEINKIHNILVEEAGTVENYHIELIEFCVFLKHSISMKVHKAITIDDSLYVIASKIKTMDEGKDYLKNYIDKLCKICLVDEQDKNAVIVNKMAMYIEEHISESISLEQLSEVSRLSSFYICKLFKKYLNKNFTDYVTSIRIKNAKKLLKDPYLSVKEICFKSGYADPNYFARVFKKETGLSPTSYRKQHIT